MNAKEKLMVILAAAIKNLYGAKGAKKTLGYGRPIISPDMGQIRFLIVKFFVGIATAKPSNCKLAFYWINTDQYSFKKKKKPPRVHIVAMGHAGEFPTPEDEQCASYIQSLLDHASPYDHTGALAEILSHESAQKFLRGYKGYFPATDVTRCLQQDVFPFAMKVFIGP